MFTNMNFSDDWSVVIFYSDLARPGPDLTQNSPVSTKLGSECGLAV